MPRLTSKQASLFAIVAFAVTLVISILMPGYPITLSGLLLVIFLTVFLPGRMSSLGPAAISVIVLAIIFWASGTNFTQYLFLLLLVFLVTAIVLYLKRLTVQLHFEKTHMTALFENATEGILLTDQEGNIVLANSASKKMFGYSAREMIGKPVEILLPNSIRERHVHLRHTFYEDPQHRSMGVGRDLYAQRKKGDNFPVEVSLSYYYHGNKRFVIAFIVNITRRKEIEESMRRQQEQLEKVSNEIRTLNADLELKVEERTLILKEALQKLELSQQELSEALEKEKQLNEIKSRFVSMASHEFRTPLSTVLSSASLLSKYVREADQEKRNKHIERIKNAVKNLNNILEDFLSLGKLDEGKIQASPDYFDLNDFVEETLEDMKGLLEEGQQIKYRHTGEPVIHTDKKLLKNVLLNLLSNAIKFSDEGSTIQLESFVQEDRVYIRIADEGIGISKEDQEHLFSSFFRGANVVNIEGTGLGLHIVKRYVALMKGTIAVDSELNKGTTITITLPTNTNDHGQKNTGD